MDKFWSTWYAPQELLSKALVLPLAPDFFCDEGFAILTEIADTMDENFSISAQRFLKYLKTNWKIRWCVVNVKNSILRTSNVLKVNFVELSDNLQYAQVVVLDVVVAHEAEVAFGPAVDLLSWSTASSGSYAEENSLISHANDVESLASSNFNEIIAQESLDSLDKNAESKYLLLIVNKFYIKWMKMTWK